MYLQAYLLDLIKSTLLFQCNVEPMVRIQLPENLMCRKDAKRSVTVLCKDTFDT